MKLMKVKNNIAFFNYINGVFRENEKTILMKWKIINFIFLKINSEQVKEVYEKIEEFFRIVSKENYEPPFNLLDGNKENNNISSKYFISKIFNRIKKEKNTEEEKEYKDSHIQILITI